MSTQEAAGTAVQGQLKASARWADGLTRAKRSIPFAARARLWLGIAAAALALSAVALLVRGVNPGIDFHGGTQLMLVDVQETNTGEVLTAVRRHADLPDVQVSQINQADFAIRTVRLSAQEIDELSAGLQAAFDITDEHVVVTNLGAWWGGAETRTALIGAVITVLLAGLVIALYLKSWRMGLSALVGLVCDVVIVLGLFALFGWEFTMGSLVALLLVMVFSLADKLVMFDKVREFTHDALTQFQATYAEKAVLGLNQMVTRSLSLAGIVILPLLAVVIVAFLPSGPLALRGPALVLLFGLTIALFSSLFVSGALFTLVTSRSLLHAQHAARVLKRRQKGGEEEGGQASGPRQDQVDSSEDSRQADVPVTATALAPGGHRGTSRQPKRTSKSQRSKSGK